MSSTALVNSWRTSTVEICLWPSPRKLQQIGPTNSPMRLDFLLDDFQGPAARIVRRGASQDRFDPQPHGSQGIVQLMGDAGRQLADAGQLGRLPELLRGGPNFFILGPEFGDGPLQICFAFPQCRLGALALGNVADDPDEDSFALHPRFGDGEFEGKLRSILSPSDDLAADADDPLLASGQIASEIAVVFIPIRRRHEHLHVMTDRFVFRKAEQLLRGGIDRLNNAAFIDADNPIDGGFQEGVHPCFAKPDSVARRLTAVLPIMGGIHAQHLPIRFDAHAVCIAYSAVCTFYQLGWFMRSE